MQPLRAQHRVERTSEGLSAWRSQALSPMERSILGALRTPHIVSDLLGTLNISPREMEECLVRMIRSGWVLIHEPQQSTVEAFVVDEVNMQDQDREDASALEALLSRHRAAQKDEAAEVFVSPSGPSVSPGSSFPPAPTSDLKETRLEVFVSPPDPAPALVEHDPGQALPFDREEAENDGLLEALRHPEVAASMGGHVEEWAPPSGGLAALLRALGEPVPEGIDLSPDQEEHLHDLAPVEPWGGSFTPARPEPQVEQGEGSFVRLRDQPSETERPRSAPQLGAFRNSLSKVQQEQAEAQAIRDRARKMREQREEEVKKVAQQNAINRQREERSREGSTLLGLSQKLAKLKNDRDQGDN